MSAKNYLNMKEVIYLRHLNLRNRDDNAKSTEKLCE